MWREKFNVNKHDSCADRYNKGFVKAKTFSSRAGKMNNVETDEEYNPCSFSKVMQSLDDYQKLLDDVKQCLDKFSMKSLLLNAELVSMFDPVKTEELEKVVLECQACADKMEQMKQQDIEQLSTSQ